MMFALLVANWPFCINKSAVLSVVPGHRADGGRGGHWLFLVLPGGQEFAHHGVIQKSHTAGRQ